MWTTRRLVTRITSRFFDYSDVDYQGDSNKNYFKVFDYSEVDSPVELAFTKDKNLLEFEELVNYLKSIEYLAASYTVELCVH